MTHNDILEMNGLSQFGNVVELFDRYLNLLAEENKKYNLTAIKEEEAFVLHIADSLIFHAEVTGENILDVGTGAGLPAVPLALVKKGSHITAMDSTAKKAAFVEKAAAYLGAGNLSVVCGRAEELGRDGLYRERFDNVTARAVANLRSLAEYCMPFVRVGGVFTAYKGAAAQEELKEAEKIIKTLGGDDGFIIRKELVMPSGERVTRALVTVRKISHTPAGYPRKNSRIGKD